MKRVNQKTSYSGRLCHQLPTLCLQEPYSNQMLDPLRSNHPTQIQTWKTSKKSKRKENWHQNLTPRKTWVDHLLQWQGICQNARSVLCANCRDQRSRIKEAERILKRYVSATNIVHIVDKARYWFRILSMMTPTTWYHVSLQCSYCDFQDLENYREMQVELGGGCQ